eukprot:s134_g17.t1
MKTIPAGAWRNEDSLVGHRSGPTEVQRRPRSKRIETEIRAMVECVETDSDYDPISDFVNGSVGMPSRPGRSKLDSPYRGAGVNVPSSHFRTSGFGEKGMGSPVREFQLLRLECLSLQPQGFAESARLVAGPYGFQTQNCDPWPNDFRNGRTLVTGHRGSKMIQPFLVLLVANHIPVGIQSTLALLGHLPSYARSCKRFWQAPDSALCSCRSWRSSSALGTRFIAKVVPDLHPSTTGMAQCLFHLFVKHLDPCISRFAGENDVAAQAKRNCAACCGNRGAKRRTKMPGFDGRIKHHRSGRSSEGHLPHPRRAHRRLQRRKHAVVHSPFGAAEEQVMSSDVRRGSTASFARYFHSGFRTVSPGQNLGTEDLWIGWRKLGTIWVVILHRQVACPIRERAY